AVAGNVSFARVVHAQVLSVIFLLKVTLISAVLASTPSAPASGTVFTTTGGTEASVTSSSAAAEDGTAKSAIRVSEGIMAILRKEMGCRNHRGKGGEMQEFNRRGAFSNHLCVFSS